MLHIVISHNDCLANYSYLYKYLPFRMSAEDLEIQPPRKKYNLRLNGSLGNGVDLILQQENGVLQGRSLPTLLDVPLHLDVDAVCVPESDTHATNCKDKQKTLVKVEME